MEMDSQTPISKDHSRKVWTPAMEHYFIDLMLEHMHRGNRMGHTFNKQAWADMLDVFNAKFGTQYDKDVLKIRYTNLWNRFNDIKNLLGQNGFSWHEMRQMVVADDYVWDTYIKAHPEARPYRTKQVLHFNDLCLIYGYTTADGRYSRSSHDIDNDEEIQGLNSGELGILASSNTERSRTDWTMEMDQYFLELLLSQQGRGNKVDNTYTKQAWTEMLGLFNAKFGAEHTKRVLRHRYKKLWKYYTDVTVLLEQKGFSWDDRQQSVAANDDVWDAYIKTHPHARSYRTKSLPDYNDLQLIFGDAIGNKIQNALHQDKNLEDEIVVAKAGRERSRTYWTPPMDHYLVDLLLDQVHRGNRIGQTFIGQSWIDMATAFNANFRSHHDKDILKNRYKHLRRQYNDVKVLLEKIGFSWDETREMVKAEDSVWDAYIEVHPDARSYRVKTVPSYHKLCVIYGEDSLDERYSRLARNVVNPENEVPLIRTDDLSPANSNPMIEWTPLMDRYFIHLVLEQMNRGNKVDHTFVGPVWVELITTFNEKFGLTYDKNIFKSRFTSVMNEYIDIRNLLNRQGFTWDETQQMVTADDHTWEAYIKEHPHAFSYRGKSLGYYKDLSTIFGSEIMDEQGICQGTGMEIDHSTLDVELLEVCGDIQISVTETETSVERKKRPTNMTPSLSEGYSKLQKTGKEDIQEAFSNVANMVSKLVNKKEDKNYIEIERSIGALQAIPDIDDDLLLDSCDLLEDERKAKTFLALGASLRKKWLLRKLGR